MLEVYSVFDKVSCTYGPLICMQNDNVLLRNVKEMIKADLNSKQSDFNKHPFDLVIYHIGTYDYNNGLLSGCVNNTKVAEVYELREQVLAEMKNAEVLNDYESLHKTQLAMAEKKKDEVWKEVIDGKEVSSK